MSFKSRFIPLKTKLIPFPNHWLDSKLSPFTMNRDSLNEAPWFKCLLWLKLTLELKWNLYIRCIAKDTGKMVVPLYHTRKYPVLSLVLYFHKSQIGSENRISLSYLDSRSPILSVQIRLRGLVGDDLFSFLQPLSPQFVIL